MEMAGRKMERKALGRTAALGDLYDARKDLFCGKSLFSDISAMEFEVVDNPSTTKTILFNDSQFNKLIKCDIDAELAISVACGLVPVSNFPNDGLVFKSPKSISEGFLIHSVSTKTDRIVENSKLRQSFISAEDLLKSNATHVVVGIEWGSNSVLTVTSVDEDAEDLKDYLEHIASQISTNGAQQESTYGPGSSKYSIQFNTDLLVPDGLQSNYIDDVIEFIGNVPKLIETNFNGRGKCVSFILVPLSPYGTTSNDVNLSNCSFQTIDTQLLCSFGDIISDINEAMVKVNGIKLLCDQNELYVPADVAKAVKMKKAMIEQTIKNITEALVNVRSGHSDAFELDVLKQTIEEVPSIEQFIEGVQNTIDRVNFVNYAKSQGALYIGQTSGFEEARRKISPVTEYYVLFYCNQSNDNQENVMLFNTFLKGKKVPCFVADVEMQPNLAKTENVPEGTRICHFIHGQYNELDIYKTYQEERVYNSVRCISKIEKTGCKPKKRVAIDLICPGSLNGGECNKEAQQWVCLGCKTTIEYGFDYKFYCECGEESANTLEFRCTDINHGENFIGFDTDVLKLELDKIRIGSEINVLVIGETGVGKSTWINAVANYLTFSTLKEAAEVKDILYLVPTRFTLLDEECKERIVSIGSSKNEETRAGQACTQHPTAHLITVGSDRIRIIDTPGIGDPRGVDQDKINVDNILKFVSNLDEIHGICLLLKPNNARLTTFFTFCVKEILAHLHKSSVDNLLFCFTNTRSTFYKPGDTFPALKELLFDINENLKIKSRGKAPQIILSSETMFCLDNEAFRFLCARRNNIDFKPEDFENFSLSWDKSATETHRMLTYIKNRKPHKVNETLSINEARNSILTLARPMARISDNIATNIRVTEQQKQFIMSLDSEKLKLESNRLVEHIQIKTVPIDYPKTVCTSASCIEIRLIPGTKENMIIYSTICHHHCDLKGVNVDTVGAPELIRCAAMLKKKCQHCGCSWHNHMHITYNFEENMVTLPDPSVEKMINDNVEAKLIKEQMIRSLEEKIKQYKAEQDQILTIGTQFGSLLKGHAILPYNDAFESHVRHELHMASAEEIISPESAIKKRCLQKMLNEYLEKKRMLDEAMSNNDIDEVIVDDVDQLKDKLMNLTLLGETFKHCFQTATNSQSQLLSYVENTVNIKPQKRKFVHIVKDRVKKFFKY